MTRGESFPKNHSPRVYGILGSATPRLKVSGLNWEKAVGYVEGHKIESSVHVTFPWPVQTPQCPTQIITDCVIPLAPQHLGGSPSPAAVGPPHHHAAKYLCTRVSSLCLCSACTNTMPLRFNVPSNPTIASYWVQKLEGMGLSQAG